MSVSLIVLLTADLPMSANAETWQLQSNSHVTDICSRILL